MSSRSEKQDWFKLSLVEELPRTTTKQQYKAAYHWLRCCRRLIHQQTITKETCLDVKQK